MNVYVDKCTDQRLVIGYIQVLSTTKIIYLFVKYDFITNLEKMVLKMSRVVWLSIEINYLFFIYNLYILFVQKVLKLIYYLILEYTVYVPNLNKIALIEKSICNNSIDF